MSVSALSQEPVVDVLHGTAVADPYRWLEDGKSVETRRWIHRQQLILNTYFSDDGSRGLLRSRVDELLNTDAFDQPVYVGDRFFYRRRLKNQEQPCIYVQDLISGKERILVDPSVDGPYISVKIHRVSHDASLLAYELRNGGADTKQIHIVDVDNGETLPEEFALGYAGGIVFAPERDGLYYCPELGSNGEDHVIAFHQLGTPTRLDQEVLRITRTPGSRLVLIADNVNIGAPWFREQGNTTTTDFYLAARSSAPQWKHIFASKQSPFVPILRNSRVLVYSRDGAPNGHIIECNYEGTTIGVIVPEQSMSLKSFSITPNRIYVSYMIAQDTQVRAWQLSGEYEGVIVAPTGGTIYFIPNLGDRDTLFYSFQSFTHPLTIFETSPNATVPNIWKHSDHSFPSDQFQVQSVSYLSKDGTLIPMSLVMHKTTDMTQEHPVIMTGYGGFGIAMTPQFSVLVGIMLELGAIFALPNIRGGSEFGEKWHTEALGRNRQVAFDDFLAGARWLCDRRVTSPQKLAIFGGSNSGLLVGAAMTQAPQLFRAVLCIAPILDMVRYEHFDHAAQWRREYGSVTDAEDFSALYAYSPYHRIEEAIDYPAALFVSGDKDDRCNPAHTRKMAAKLQNRVFQKRPILVDYSRERGHSAVLPLSVRIDALARRLTFLCNELGIQIPPERSHASANS